MSEPRLWSIRSWRYAFPAGVISQLGDIVFDLTVVLWISTDIAAGQPWAPAAVSGVLIAAALPILLVGPIAGVYADRVDRHRMLVRSNAVQAVAIASLLLVPVLEGRLGVVVSLGWVYAAIAVSNAAGQFFNQALLAMIAKTVPDDMRTRAFSARGSAASVLRIVGPPLAAPLLFTAGVEWALLINAASFAASSLLLRQTSWDSRPEQSATEGSFWASVAGGARAVRRNRVLLAICASVTVATLGTGAITVLEVFYVTDVLHQDAGILGLMSMAFAVGTLLGVVAAPRAERRLGATAIYLGGMALMGLLLIGYSLTVRLGPAMVLYFLTAIPLGMVNTVLSPLVMRSIPPDLLGRSMVVLNVFPTLASLTAMGATGWLVSTLLSGVDATVLGVHFGPVDTVFAAGGVLILATAVGVAPPILRAHRATSPELSARESAITH
jgi:MFS family permease